MSGIFCVLNDSLYVATGFNYLTVFTYCYRYDVTTNAWVPEPDFTCIAPGRLCAQGFVLNGHGYIQFGSNYDFTVQYNDMLEFGPSDTTFAVRVHVLGNDTSYCGNFNRVLSTGNNCTLWSTGVTASQIRVYTPGTYWGQLPDSCGILSDTIKIAQTPGVNLNLGNDTSVCTVQPVILNATTSAAAPAIYGKIVQHHQPIP